MIDSKSLFDAGDLVLDSQNKRVKLHQYPAGQFDELDELMKKQAEAIDASKIIIYAKKADVTQWQSRGYVLEGRIDGFFRGENAYLLSLFLTPERGTSAAPELAEENLKLSLAKAGTEAKKTLPPGYSMREAGEADAEALAKLYGLVFATYPTPMDDPAYIVKAMRGGTRFIVAEQDGEIACAASAEVTERFGSAEMTDCATHPAHAGKGLLQPIFLALEKKMEEAGIYFLYSLTRAQSASMNITAAKMGYEYRGRLINNCTIFSGFEDMNIWVKPLRPVWE